jgi:hypothetical protein
MSEHEDTITDRFQRELLLPAETSAVWDVVTGPGWLADEVELDMRPGGDASFRSRGGERSGWVEEASPPAGDHAPGQLTFWWASQGEPATRVELTIEPAGDDCSRLRVVESRPFEVLDLTGLPIDLPGQSSLGPSLVAA